MAIVYFSVVWVDGGVRVRSCLSVQKTACVPPHKANHGIPRVWPKSGRFVQSCLTGESLKTNVSFGKFSPPSTCPQRCEVLDKVVFWSSERIHSRSGGKQVAVKNRRSRSRRCVSDVSESAYGKAPLGCPTSADWGMQVTCASSPPLSFLPDLQLPSSIDNRKYPLLFVRV